MRMFSCRYSGGEVFGAERIVNSDPSKKKVTKISLSIMPASLKEIIVRQLDLFR